MKRERDQEILEEATAVVDTAPATDHEDGWTTYQARTMQVITPPGGRYFVVRPVHGHQRTFMASEAPGLISHDRRRRGRP